MDRRPLPPAALFLVPRRALGRGVVLVDPDTQLRRAVRALLEGYHLPVVAEVADVGQAVTVAAPQHPAVVVTMHLGDREVLRAAREIAAMGPRVVLLTSTDPAVVAGPAVEPGACTAVAKGDAAGLGAAVRRAAVREPGR